MSDKKIPSSRGTSPLPTLPWLTRLDLERDPTPADFAAMISAQRELIEELRAREPHPCAELEAHQRIVRHLESEFRRLSAVQTAPPPAEDPVVAARRLADVFHFEVPPSHRRRLGQAVTGGKRLLVNGLKPFHVESLRPQFAFNHALVDALETLAHPQSTHEAIAARVGPALDANSDPTRWVIPSRRSSVVGGVVKLAKQSYLGVLEPVLRSLLQRQHEWNKTATRILRTIANPAEPLETTMSDLEALGALVDLFEGVELPRPLNATLALWREVFRRQVEFNQAATRALASFVRQRRASATDYERWCREVEPKQIDRALAAVKSVPYRPLLSLVVPTYETPEPVLRACLESVLSQGYANWELCITDDASRAPHVRSVIEEYARRDSRIRVTFLKQNGGIAVATNIALEGSSGDYVCFLDHDDVLAPHALAEVVVHLNEHPTTDLLYSDEDRLDLAGRRVAPFFKPDWSPDLLRSGNYVCHFLVIRRELVDSIGRVRTGFDGAQDYDLILRATERARRVGHIASVLYHWRASPQSMALDVGNKPVASDRGKLAVEEHLARCGESATVEVPLPTTYRVRYPVRGKPLVSIIVPFKDKPELLDQLVGSLLPTTKYENFELLLVSNNSVQPETAALLDRLTDPRIRKLTWDQPFNFSAINNFAVQHARGELLLFLNNDIEIVEEGWLEELVGQAQRPEVGAVGARLLYPNRTLQHAGVVVGIDGFASHVFPGGPNDASWTSFGHAMWTRNYLAVTAACMMMRRDVFDAVGGFDERFIVCGSDVEICLRAIEAGKRVVYTPHATLVHHESATRKVDSIPEVDFWRSYVAYRPYLAGGDPFYNRNLSLRVADGSFRFEETSAEDLAVNVLARDLPSTRQPPPARARIDYQRHIADHLPGMDYTPAEIRAARTEGPRAMERLRKSGKLESITWLVPYFGHPYGGVHTILRFAHLFRTRHGVRNHFVIYDNPNADAAALEARVATLFPEVPGTFQVLRRREEVRDVAPSDLGIGTLWNSTYYLLQYRGTRAKAYFIQDYEPVFYPAGSYYALAEQSYRMGLFGIFNTEGLRSFICSNYPMDGVSFEPAVDPNIFHDRSRSGRGPVRIFFYGRPSVDRNAFELGLAVLRELKRELGTRVDIVTAGEPWNPQDYGVAGAITNLGVLPYEKTGDLYRSTDIGLCFMFSKHPSYPPMEMMASGVTVVTNNNPANLWLFEDGKNCLLTEPTYSAVLDRLRLAVSDAGLRGRIGATAAARMRQTTWETQADRVFAALTGRASDSARPHLRPLGTHG